MPVKVPEVQRCCFCFPLRQGIIVFGFINILFSLAAVACLITTTEWKKATIYDGSSLEVVTSTILFSILGMGVILNLMLLVAGYQKDVQVLRLYLYYGLLTILAALVPTFILLYKGMFYDVIIALVALSMQWYVIVVVRSEIIILEQLASPQENEDDTQEIAIDVPDRDTLL